MKHARIVFAVLLLLSALVTAFLGLRTLFDPEGMMQSFGVTTRPEGLELLISVLGAAILSLALFVFLAAWWSFQSKPEGRTLGILCAATLILVALAAWQIGGSTQVLMLDGIRGAVLIVVGLLWRPSPSSSSE